MSDSKKRRSKTRKLGNYKKHGMNRDLSDFAKSVASEKPIKHYTADGKVMVFPNTKEYRNWLYNERRKNRDSPPGPTP